MSFSIYYHEAVAEDDIPALSAITRERVQKAIEEKLATNPEVFGKPLRRSLRGYRALRVGDYRIVFRITGKAIFILAIQHRSVIYKTKRQ